MKPIKLPTFSDLDLAGESDPWEISVTARLIRDRGYRCVALQLPNELLPSAIELAAHLRKLVNSDSSDSSIRVYVLAGSLHCSCCVDEVAAAHMNADVIIHYGHACFSKKWNTPAHFVLGPSPPLDVPKITARFAATVEALRGNGLSSPILVLYTLDCYQTIQQLQNSSSSDMQELLRCGHIQFAKPGLTNQDTNNEIRSCEQGSHRYVNGLEWPSDVSAARCIWIGSGNDGSGASTSRELNIMSLLVQLQGEVKEFSQASVEELCVCEVDIPSTTNAHPFQFFKPEDNYPLLRRRAGVLARARAEIESGGLIGILIEPDGYMSDRNIHDLSTIIGHISKHHPIKALLLSVGRPNAAKLGNFVLDVAVFVLAGCQEAAGEFIMSSDAREVPTPVLLIAEAKGLLNAFAESNCFDLDFKEKEQSSDIDESTTVLALRQPNDINSVRKGFAGTLSRSWHGLSYEVGEDKPITIHEGRSGRAAVYDAEGK